MNNKGQSPPIQKVPTSVEQLLLQLPSNFQNKKEFIFLHNQSTTLATQMKFRRELDIYYTKLRLQKLNQEIEEEKIRKEFAKQKNDDILKELQKIHFKLYTFAKSSKETKDNLNLLKQKYNDYLSYVSPQIKTEFLYQLSEKQNELFAMKAVLENQLLQTEKLSALQNEYYQRLNKKNEEILNDIRSLQEKKEVLEKERIEKFKEHQSKQIEIYQNLEEIKLRQKMMEEKYDKEMEKNVSLERKVNEHHKFVKKENILKESKLNQNKLEESIEINQSTNSLIKNKLTVSFMERRYELNLNHKPGKLDEIRQSKIDLENKKFKEEEKEQIKKSLLQSSQLSGSKIIGEKNIKSSQKNKFNIKDENKKMSNIKEESILEKNDSNNDNFKNNDITITNKKENQDSKTIIITDNKNNNQYDSSKNMKENIDTFHIEEVKQKEKNKNKITNSISQESKSQRESKIKSSNQNSPKSEKIIETFYSAFEKLKIERPNLNSPDITNEYRVMVLQKIIQKTTKYCDTQKPGKAVYERKHSNTKNNKQELHDKFYDLLITMKENPDKVDETFNSLNIELSLLFIVEFLYNNPKFNLKPQNLKNNSNYSENDFDNDLDKSYKEIIDPIMEHMKIMVSKKRVSLQNACNIIANGLLNFESDETMKSRLLLVLEKKLSNKGGSTNLMNTFIHGFNPMQSSIGGIQMINLRNSIKDNKSKTGGNNVFADYQ